MIIGILTVCGKPIAGLRPFSGKKVLRKCDLCGKVSPTKFEHLTTCRKRHNTDKDYCQPCSIKIYSSGENNPAKRQSVRDVMSKRTRGVPKKFLSGKNPRIIDKKHTVNGYVLAWDRDRNTHVPEHRLVVEKNIGRQLADSERVHHINGDKKDNRLENLALCATASQHNSVHGSILSCCQQLIEDGIIAYDRGQHKYFVNPDYARKEIPISLGFDCVAISQNKNMCESRLDVDISCEVIRDIYRPVPIMAANMSTVINADFAILLYRLGAMGVLHRADTTDNLIACTKTVSNECENVFVSVGVGDNQISLAKTLISNGATVVFIDVAHGYSNAVFDIAKAIKKYSVKTKIVVGNTTNIEMAYECYKLVDAIKVGIGQGFACETKDTAACTEGQFSVVLKFRNIYRDFGIPIISDGGVRKPADFVKAIAAGANSVMAGKIFASCPESAAELVEINGEPKKKYAGMASRFVQEEWKGRLKQGTCAEGCIKYLCVGESAKSLLERYSGALRSGITYAGASNISGFHEKVEFVRLIGGSNV